MAQFAAELLVGDILQDFSHIAFGLIYVILIAKFNTGCGSERPLRRVDLPYLATNMDRPI